MTVKTNCNNFYDGSIIKPTSYNGILFRSRLEARWAVFMDSLNVRYIYEPECYNINKCLYVPDFYIPSLECFLEIKPEGYKNDETNEKCWYLADETHKIVYLIAMDIPNESAIDICGHDWNSKGIIEAFCRECGVDFPYSWCECDKCKKIGIEFDARSARLCNCNIDSDKNYNGNSKRLLSAYKTAKGYKFYNTYNFN
jgi:hypothetical protein